LFFFSVDNCGSSNNEMLREKWTR